MNNLTNSLNMSGLWIILLEVMIVMNLPTRPWNSDGEWQRLVGAAEQYHRCAGPDNELFQCLYAAIAEDDAMGNGDETTRHMSGDVGTRTHMHTT